MQPRKTYTAVNETGCCAVPNVSAWDGVTFTWKDKPFVQENALSFLYIPLTLGGAMQRLQSSIESAKAGVPADEWLVLSHDPSPWRSEHLAAVTKPVPGAKNVTLSGTFTSKVFEGPFQKVGTWSTAMAASVKKQGKTLVKQYFFYTTCPKCAKHYGKNYVIAIAEVR